MVEREKVIKGLQICSQSKSEHKQCPYYPHNTDDKDCITKLTSDALALILSLQEDIEVWKQRYKWKVIERKTSDDPNKGPNIVKVFTTEEMERMEMKQDG